MSEGALLKVRDADGSAYSCSGYRAGTSTGYLVSGLRLYLSRLEPITIDGNDTLSTRALARVLCISRYRRSYTNWSCFCSYEFKSQNYS